VILPNVIDSLIVTLGLDPKGFTDGQKKAIEGLKKTADSSIASGKLIEESSQKAADSVGRITKQVLTLYAVLLGGKGLSSFAADITTSDAALGRFSANIGMSAKDVQEWGLAAERMGGSAAGAQQTLQGAADALNNMRLNGINPDSPIFKLLAKAGMTVDLTHGPQKLLLDMATAAERMAKAGDRPGAMLWLKQSGVDDASANAMVKYGAGFKTYLDSLGSLTMTDGQIAKLTQLQNSWESLSQTVQKSFADMWAKISPQLTEMLDGLDKWIKANPEIAKTIEVATVALGTLFGLGVAAKFLAIVSGIRSIGVALGAAATSGAPLLAVLAALGFDAYKNTVKEAGKGEDKVLANEGWRRAAQGFRPGDIYDPATGTYSHPGATGGSSGSQAEHEAYIRQSAIARGIDPDIAMRVAKSEGFYNHTGDQGTSFGDYQLHYGGRAGGALASSGMGDDFTKSTGLDASNPTTWKSQIDYALDHAAKSGWGAWYGARSVGISGMQGIGLPATGVTGASAGAMSSIQNNQRTSTSTSSNEANIGAVNVYPPSGDAAGIAASIGPALRRSMMAWAANTGLA
jgi:hypothetical protein